MRPLLIILMLALALPVSAQIYKYTDSKGNTVFTNQPPDGTPAETVELPPTNTVEMQTPSLPAADPQPEASSAQPYSVLRLSDVPDDAAMRANNGTFTVGVDIQPRLGAGHTLRLLVDGEPHGQPTNVPRLQAVNIDRGEHSLAVEVLSQGRSIQQSPSVTFTVQRISVNSPARAQPAAPGPAPRPAN